MKSLRIIAISLFCALVFCSCKSNNDKLESDSWELDAEASYYVNHNERHYADEFPGQYFWDFNEGEVVIYKGEKHKTTKYHTDKNHFYIDGTDFTIIKLNSRKLICEVIDDNGFHHLEFNRINHNFLPTAQKENARPIEAAMQDAPMSNQTQIDTLSYEESLRYLDSLNKLSRQTKIDTLD